MAEFLTPVGRIVWGNPGRSSIKKDIHTKQPVIRDGKQVEIWSFGLAIPKNEFNQNVLPYLQQAANSGYPNGVPSGFAWKYKDGDGVDRNGKPYNLREGYAGHMVLSIVTEAFAPPMYKFENGAYRQITADEIKTGDFVRVNLNVKVNVPTNKQHTPGLYVNPNGIELVGYGEEIRQTADPDEMFGGQPAQLPPGASSTPVSSAPHNAMMPSTNAQPQGYQQPMQQPAQPNQDYQQPMQQPQVNMPPPAHDFVQNATGGNQYPQQGAPNAAQPQHQPNMYGQPANGYASNATQSPGNVMPGMPQQ